MDGSSMTLRDLHDAVAGSAAALRCRRRLQPAGGAGDKVFPPTFAGATYAIEQRRIPGRDSPVTCVLLDSVQSQANRMELALQDAVDARKITLPLVVVDFSEYDPTGDLDADERAGRLIDRVGTVTSLQVPHRLADAILRYSELDGVPFRRSVRGKALNTLSVTSATPLFELCPTALVFGMWDSTGPKGGLGPKFERAIVSEIVGVGAVWERDYRARGVRRDPFEISKTLRIVASEDRSQIDVASSTERRARRPSELGLSSVTFESPNAGVTIEYAEQTTTLSLICLRRLRFPRNGRPPGADADVAARTVLAAVGLCATTLAFEAGSDLRSRCLLWPDGPMTWDLLDRPGATPRTFSLSAEEALVLLNEATVEAKSMGLSWPDEPVVLKPSRALIELVRLSQLQATREPAAEA
jgi:CRISPR-associated protein Csb1